jgi:glyoxylase-like metal-dependent hydrolase (beta-lactamase superfamily II)
MAAKLPEPIILIAKRSGDVRIHTFISAFTDSNIANATHIIESKNSLVLIDGQFLATYARKFRAYADSLDKPIDRLYVSHRHPDHWFGLGTAFDDVEIYALEETATFINANGKAMVEDHAAKLGDENPKKIVPLLNFVTLEPETIDGVTYIYEKIVDTEIDYLLAIGIPELGVYIPQDLIYSGTHLYLTTEMGPWLLALGRMLASNYELFMPGHGLPADKAEVGRNAEYLAAAKVAFDNGLKGDDFRTFLLQRYPARLCPGIFDIYLPRLFGGARQF